MRTGRPAIITPLILKAVGVTPRATPSRIYEVIGKVTTYRVLIMLMGRMAKDGRLFASGPKRFHFYFLTAAEADAWAADEFHAPDVVKARRAESQRQMAMRRYERIKASQEPVAPQVDKPVKPAKVVKTKPVPIGFKHIARAPRITEAWKNAEANTVGAKVTKCPSGRDTRFDVPADFIGEFALLRPGRYLDVLGEPS